MFWCGCNGSADPDAHWGAVGNAYRVSLIHFQRSFCRIQTAEAGDEKSDRIEACVQLKDQFDDPIKALGSFRFEIYRYQPAVSDPRGKRFGADGVQEIDLSEININQKRWDSITRSYRMNLKFPPEAAKVKKIVLQVTFTMDPEYRVRDILELENKS
jgi:hypothetical protein